MRHTPLLITVIVFFAMGCAFRTPPQFSLQIEGQDGAVQVLPGPSNRAEWVLAGLARVRALQARPPSHNDSGDDFVIELAAHHAVLSAYRGLRKQNDPLLSLLSEIEAQGLLEEYIISAWARPGWTVPGAALAELDVPRFTRFAKERLDGVSLLRDGGVLPANHKRWPDVPGGELFDARPLQAQGVDVLCASRDAIDQAAASWLDTPPALDGVPLPATSRSDFLWRLGAVQSDPVHQERGATWVDERVGSTLNSAVFCAVEANDAAVAERYLMALQQMLPYDDAVALELAHVPTLNQDYATSLVRAQAIIARSDDTCTLANAWRKVGFAQFELQQNRAAYKSYLTSLEYEPGNAIAEKEIALLERLAGTPSENREAAKRVGVSAVQTVVAPCKR